jgi:hypothetical protein
MRSFYRRPELVPNANGGTYSGTNPATSRYYDLESWAFEHFGAMMQGDIRPGNNSAHNPSDFGANRPAPEGQHFYQKIRSGTYATIDELVIHTKWKDCTKDGDDGWDWPMKQRSVGRYYFDRRNSSRPSFRSQTLFSSEQAQSYRFADDESDTVVELGTVRWTVFTPHYCMHQPGAPEYEFPYDSYFVETDDTGIRTRAVSQSWRPGRADWKNGTPQARNSSMRGCTVSIMATGASLSTNPGDEYVDPERWSPILAAGAVNGRHARSRIDELRYVVRFGLSKEETDRANGDTVLLDTPVLDDVTITYLCRPKVVAWRDVSE